MALSKASVTKACEILQRINPQVPPEKVVTDDNEFRYWKIRISRFDPDNEFQLNAILGCDEKLDGGYESIVMNVKGITPEQLELFNEMKKAIPNSSICRDLGNGITRIGWF